MDWVMVVGGLALLLPGGDVLVRGACGIALQLRISPADNLWMMAFSLLLLPIIRTGMVVSRRESLLLLTLFGIYMALTIGR
jgi:Ca2+/Na+ antiporter